MTPTPAADLDWQCDGTAARDAPRWTSASTVGLTIGECSDRDRLGHGTDAVWPPIGLTRVWRYTAGYQWSGGASAC